MVFREPLELQYWLMNVFSGNSEIFFFLATILISGMAARFRMNNFVFLLSIGLFAVLMANYIGGLYILVILAASMIVFIGISRTVKS